MESFKSLNSSLPMILDIDQKSFRDFVESALKTNNVTELRNLVLYQNFTFINRASAIDLDLASIVSRITKCNSTLLNSTGLVDVNSRKEITNRTADVIKSVRILSNQIVYVRNGYKRTLLKVLDYATYPFETLESFRNLTVSLYHEATQRYVMFVDSIKRAKNDLYDNLLKYQNIVNNIIK